MKNYSVSKLILILTPFVFSFAFGLDIYIPIVPQMMEIFGASQTLIQLTLSLFLMATGVGQLFIGPLSDHFGRKPIFYAASFCFSFGALVCAFSPTINCLIVARVISALGACGMLVTAFAVVRDLFDSEESAKMYSFLNGAIGVSPTLAPMIGGYLAYYFGWQSVFFFLAGIGLLGYLVTFASIKETHPKEKRVKVDGTLFWRYLQIFSHPQFLIYSIIAGFAEGVFFCFFSLSPFIIIEELGVATHEFGYYFAVFGAVIGLGGFASGKVIEKIGVQKTIRTGITMMFIGGGMMLAWNSVAALSLPSFLLPMVVACTGAMFLCGGSAALSLEPFGEMAGTASAAFGATQFTVSAVAGTLLMLFPATTAIPYSISILIMAGFSTALFRARKRVRSSQEEMCH